MIIKDTTIPPTVTVYGQTEIVAEVRRVDGQGLTAVLQTLQGDTLSCATTVEIARQLGGSLAQQVRVSGTAGWDVETLAITHFAIAAVRPYRRVAAAQAFALLRERFGAHFDQIDDPNDWARRARQGEASRCG